MNGYAIEVGICSGILARARADEGIAGAVQALESSYGEAADSCGSVPVAAALLEIGEMLAQQGDYAAARVENAVDGVSKAVSAYIQGDRDMAEAARLSVNQTPRLEHDPVGSRGILAVG